MQNLFSVGTDLLNPSWYCFSSCHVMYPALAGNINAAVLLRAEGEIQSSPRSPFRYLVVPSSSWAVRWGADFVMCHISKQPSCPSFPMKGVSHMLLHVQGWALWSYCISLGVGWAGLSKAAAELYHIPVLHTAQKFFEYRLTLSFFVLTFFFPCYTGQQWKLCMFYVKYRV